MGQCILLYILRLKVGKLKHYIEKQTITNTEKLHWIKTNTHVKQMREEMSHLMHTTAKL